MSLRNGTAALDGALRDRLTIARHSVTSEVERFRYLPGVIGQDERIAQLLATPHDAQVVARANAYLESVRDLSGVDELYVLDAAGLTLAASNWATPGSFVGQNYGFRPYFRDAITGGEGRYYAVGVTTGKPGSFLSAHLGGAGGPAGVAVAKVDMAALEQAWVRAGEATGLVDDAGIAFLSGYQGWKYRPLAPLDPETLARLALERRYDGLDLAAAPVLQTGVLPDGSAFVLEAGQRLKLGYAAVESGDWQLFVALPMAPVEERARLLAALTALAGLLVSVVAMIVWQRRQITQLKLEQNAVLEARVAERTEALAHEVEERRRTEEELRRTHDSLLHAAKLAVLGRMSAAIVHEVSQPLSALDNTLAAAELHNKAGAGVQVARNLDSARGLLRRMQDMVRHLKSFSARNRAAAPEPVDMAAVLALACEIVEPRARELGVGVRYTPPDALPPVAGNAVRLQQVATNLLLNAIEASAAHGGQGVSAALTLEGGALRMCIADDGPGIPADLGDQILEPFFSTKVTGEGLGLGLSIVRTILEQSGARLSFAPRDGGGTIARVEMPLWQAERQQGVA